MRIINEINAHNAQNARTGRSYPVAAAAALKGTSSDKLVITQLVQEFADISRKNINDWRQGLQATMNPEEPKWNLLQDLYEYLMPDGHFGSQAEIRNGTIEANRYYVRNRKTNKEDPEKSKVFEAEWFFNLLGYMLDSTIFKTSPFQLYIDPIEGIRYDEIPRRNFIPQRGMILKSVTDSKGFLINDPAFNGTIIVVTHRSKAGIMNDIVPDLIWKKNARQTWAEFSEKFGIPLISATTNSRDAKEIDRIEAMLKQLGKAAQAVLPTGTLIDIKSPDVKGDPYNVFLKQMEYSDAQISKRILGGTMISDNGSSRSQSEVHERTLNYIISERERRRIEFVVNGKIIPALIALGVNLNAETDEFVFDRTQELTLTEHWDIVSAAMEHYDIPDEWISERFNFPINGRKEQVTTQETPVPPKKGKVSAQAKQNPSGGFFG
jgi:hypothetical protein